MALGVLVKDKKYSKDKADKGQKWKTRWYRFDIFLRLFFCVIHFAFCEKYCCFLHVFLRWLKLLEAFLN